MDDGASPAPDECLPVPAQPVWWESTTSPPPCGRPLAIDLPPRTQVSTWLWWLAKTGRPAPDALPAPGLRLPERPSGALNDAALRRPQDSGLAGRAGDEPHAQVRMVLRVCRGAGRLTCPARLGNERTGRRGADLAGGTPDRSQPRPREHAALPAMAAAGGRSGVPHEGHLAADKRLVLSSCSGCRLAEPARHRRAGGAACLCSPGRGDRRGCRPRPGATFPDRVYSRPRPGDGVLAVTTHPQAGVTRRTPAHSASRRDW